MTAWTRLKGALAVLYIMRAANYGSRPGRLNLMLSGPDPRGVDPAGRHGRHWLPSPWRGPRAGIPLQTDLTLPYLYRYYAVLWRVVRT